MTDHGSGSFSAGQDAGMRISAWVVRMAAQELVDASRWWNRRRHRFMARAMVACADELEQDVDERSAEGAGEPAVAAIGRAPGAR